MKEVICIKTHSQGVVKEGVIYPLLEIKDVKCHCGPKTLYNVGVLSPGINNIKYSCCGNCGYKIRNYTNYRWVQSILFAEVADISELVESLNIKQGSM